jgi:hypothetical protein
MIFFDAFKPEVSRFASTGGRHPKDSIERIAGDTSYEFICSVRLISFVSLIRKRSQIELMADLSQQQVSQSTVAFGTPELFQPTKTDSPAIRRILCELNVSKSENPLPYVTYRIEHDNLVYFPAACCVRC